MTTRVRLALALAQFLGCVIGFLLGGLVFTRQAAPAYIVALLIASGVTAALAYLVADGEWGKA